MAYVKGLLCVLAAVSIGMFVPGLIHVLRGISAERATGVAAIAGSVIESLYSPAFWILAVVSFIILFAASRAGSRTLQVALFWIPSVVLSTFAVGMFALFTYIWLHTSGFISSKVDGPLLRGLHHTQVH